MYFNPELDGAFPAPHIVFINSHSADDVDTESPETYLKKFNWIMRKVTKRGWMVIVPFAGQ